MRVTHFVDHRQAAPLCGTLEHSDWIGTSRPQAVTCDRCAARLAGVREQEASFLQSTA